MTRSRTKKKYRVQVDASMTLDFDVEATGPADAVLKMKKILDGKTEPNRLKEIRSDFGYYCNSEGPDMLKPTGDVEEVDDG
jgi:hypothetical protein